MGRAVLILVFVGCSKEAPRTATHTGSAADAATVPGIAPRVVVETHDFYRIRFAAPVGSNLANSGNSLPGPEQVTQPGEPPPPPPVIRPGVAIIMPNTNRYHVGIVKEPEPSSLAGWRAGFQALPQTVSVAPGKQTPTGWESMYTWKADDGTLTNIFVHYLQLAGEQYQCTYDDRNSKQLVEAEAICRSMAKR